MSEQTININADAPNFDKLQADFEKALGGNPNYIDGKKQEEIIALLEQYIDKRMFLLYNLAFWKAETENFKDGLKAINKVSSLIKALQEIKKTSPLQPLF